MAWFLLILVLIALAFGVLGIVIKATVVIVLTILFTIAALVLLAVLAFRHQANRVRRELDKRFPR